MLKISAMSKFQGVLKMFMLGVLKTISKTVLKYEKTPSHFTARVEIERQISFFSFGFARVSEVRHMCENRISWKKCTQSFHNIHTYIHT